MGGGGDWGREEGVVLLLRALSTKTNNKFYSFEELIIEPHHNKHLQQGLENWCPVKSSSYFQAATRSFTKPLSLSISVIVI